MSATQKAPRYYLSTTRTARPCCTKYWNLIQLHLVGLECRRRAAEHGAVALEVVAHLADRARRVQAADVAVVALRAGDHEASAHERAQLGHAQRDECREAAEREQEPEQRAVRVPLAVKERQEGEHDAKETYEETRVGQARGSECVRVALELESRLELCDREARAERDGPEVGALVVELLELRRAPRVQPDAVHVDLLALWVATLVHGRENGHEAARGRYALERRQARRARDGAGVRGGRGLGRVERELHDGCVTKRFELWWVCGLRLKSENEVKRETLGRAS